MFHNTAATSHFMWDLGSRVGIRLIKKDKICEPLALCRFEEFKGGSAGGLPHCSHSRGTCRWRHLRLGRTWSKSPPPTSTSHHLDRDQVHETRTSWLGSPAHGQLDKANCRRDQDQDLSLATRHDFKTWASPLATTDFPFWLLSKRGIGHLHYKPNSVGFVRFVS